MQKKISIICLIFFEIINYYFVYFSATVKLTAPWRGNSTLLVLFIHRVSYCGHLIVCRLSFNIVYLFSGNSSYWKAETGKSGPIGLSAFFMEGVLLCLWRSNSSRTWTRDEILSCFVVQLQVSSSREFLEGRFKNRQKSVLRNRDHRSVKPDRFHRLVGCYLSD